MPGDPVALDEGDAFVQANIDKATKNRDVFCDALIATNRVETLKPDGALYAFLKIDGVTDSRHAALDIVDRTALAQSTPNDGDLLVVEVRVAEVTATTVAITESTSIQTLKCTYDRGTGIMVQYDRTDPAPTNMETHLRFARQE